MIYFIREDVPDGLIKIGLTTQVPQRRFKNIQADNSNKLTVIACVPGDARDEAELHRRFATHRAHGEWFRPHDEIVHFVAGLLWAYRTRAAAKEESCLPANALKQIAGESFNKGGSYRTMVRECARAIMLEALAANSGNVSRTAKALGLSRESVYYVFRERRLRIETDTTGGVSGAQDSGMRGVRRRIRTPARESTDRQPNCQPE